MNTSNASRGSAISIGTMPLNELQSKLQSKSLFAILDACDEPRVLNKVEELGKERSVSLYRGTAEEDFKAIAPYLVQIDSDILQWIVSNLWNDPWGIFFVAPNGMSDARKHFRRFLRVELPDRQKAFFRFYDPRVLKNYLVTATLEEAIDFFGDVRSFYLGDGSDELHVITRQRYTQ